MTDLELDNRLINALQRAGRAVFIALASYCLLKTQSYIPQGNAELLALSLGLLSAVRVYDRVVLVALLALLLMAFISRELVGTMVAVLRP